MLIFTANTFFDAKKKLHETDKNINSYILIFFQPKVITTSIIMILYVILFVSKLSHLNIDLNNVLIIDLANKYGSAIYYDFYPIVQKYELVVILETVIIFSLFARMIFFIYDYPRVNTFFIFLFNSFKKIIVFFIILMMFIICNAIFANNLWGNNYEVYKDLPASITNILLFSIGHFQIQIYGQSFTIWNIIFTLQFFFIFIFYCLTTFVGIFLESYRITSLEIGYSYDSRKGEEDLQKKDLNK